MDRMDGHPDSFCCAVLRLRLGGHSQLTASFQDPAWQLQVGQAAAAAALLQVIRVGLELAQRDSPPKASTPHLHSAAFGGRVARQSTLANYSFTSPP